MIAAFKVLLPYQLSLVTQLPMSALLAEVGDLAFEIHPPYQSFVTESDVATVSQVALTDILTKLGKNDTPSVNPNIRIDGKTSFLATIAVNFRKGHFDRAIPTPGVARQTDPPIDLVFGVLNRLLEQIKEITKAPFIRPIGPERSIWRMDYFNDDGSELVREDGKLRGHLTTGFQWKYCALNEQVWTSLLKLPYDRPMPVWESLYLDAIDTLPDIGPSIVLAFSAIEVLVSQVLDHHARQKVVPYGLWEWLNDRKQYWHEPSISDRLDRILKELVGASAREDSTRWQTFTKLKQARDSFVHTGTITIGQPVTDQAAMEALVIQSKTIIDWLSSYLPPEQRPFVPEYSINLETLRRLS